VILSKAARRTTAAVGDHGGGEGSRWGMVMSGGGEITTQGQGGHATVAVDPLCDFDRSGSYGPFATRATVHTTNTISPRLSFVGAAANGWVGVGSGPAASDAQC
jgi:hypothetical protein